MTRAALQQVNPDLIVLTVAAIVCCGVFLLAKAYFLAPSALGWLMVMANSLYETVEKRLRLTRGFQDVALLLASCGCIAVAFGPWVALLVAVGMSLSWALALHVDLRWRADVPAFQDRRLPRVPLPVPRLAVVLRGPVLRRRRLRYSLGDWPIGLEQPFELLVLNPTTVRPQLPLDVSVESRSPELAVSLDPVPKVAPEPGQFVRIRFRAVARAEARGSEIVVRVAHGDRQWIRTLRLDASFDLGTIQVASAGVSRWMHGCSSSFAWRGDHDLYDPSTFQSEFGLRVALGLARRFCVPTTVMLSSRLSLEQADHAEFCRRFGWDRRSAEIPGFIRFLRDEVDTANEQDFPVSSDRPVAAEIGNHMHLHYGTHAAADPGNGWKSHARAGAGTYPWMSRSPASSFEEQRDNMLACAASIRNHVGIETSCFAIPSDFYDADTSRAAEAAGIDVGIDTDSTKFERQFVFPAEHHPEGCARFVELTRMSPRDPVNAPQVAVLKYWVGFARRKRRALVYLAHHHLLMYQGNSCLALTAELLRHVVADSEGDVHVATVTSLGRYWRDVLSERTRCLAVSCGGRVVTASNCGDRNLCGIPVEVEFSGGRRMMRIVDVPAGAEVDVLSQARGPEAGQL